MSQEVREEQENEPLILQQRQMPIAFKNDNFMVKKFILEREKCI